MAFSSPITAVTGATFTATQYNTSVRDTVAAIWVGTAAGDIDYYSSSTAKARLAKPTVSQILSNGLSGVLAWSNTIGTIHASAISLYNPNNFTSTSTSYVDVKNATGSIVISKTCTVYMIAVGTRRHSFLSQARSYTQPVIDGTAPVDDGGASFLYTPTASASYYSYVLFHKKAGVAAGTISCKIQTKVVSATNTVRHDFYGTMLLFAVVE